MEVYPDRQHHNRQRNRYGPENPELWRDMERILTVGVDEIEELATKNGLLKSAVNLFVAPQSVQTYCDSRDRQED
jgi:hypothetical protein